MFKFARHQAARELDDSRDLGFGSFVSETSRNRLLNRDGTFNVRRTGLRFFGSLNLYHWLLNLHWLRLVGLVTVVYLSVNLLFATAYFLCGPGALSDRIDEGAFTHFWHAFFFSVHTFATIGYGNVSPVSLGANLIVTVEALVGLMGFALATGILFARFSRPTAKLLFSKTAVIAPYRNITGFMFRTTNARHNQLFELHAKVIFTRFETVSGTNIRKYYQLDLERRSVAVFPLNWTVVHPITEDSPLYGLTHDDLKHDNAEFLLLFNGFDETFSQTVHTRSSYIADEIQWGAKFTSMYNPMTEGEDLSIDVRALDNTEPAPLPVVERKAEAASG
ncbi:MAG: ion channel [Pyrinomonadaceae bacterium]